MRTQRKGFTLIELTLVILLVGLLAGVSALILEKIGRMSLLNTTLSHLYWENRIAIERMGREISVARSNSNVDLIMGANALTFTDMDGQTITYALSGNVLQRNSQPLASNVTSLNFNYYDAGLNEVDPVTGDPLDVRYLRIELEAAKDGNVTSEHVIVFPRSY